MRYIILKKCLYLPMRPLQDSNLVNEELMMADQLRYRSLPVYCVLKYMFIINILYFFLLFKHNHFIKY